jgi:ribulose-5-phosphate 4-epimerase/fuculose-1-phosphate aldolase
MASRLSEVGSSVRDQVTAEEWKTRVDLAAAYRLVAHFGWDDLIFTHLSARVPGPEEHFLINPLGLMFEEVTASNLVKVDLEGNIVLPTGYNINPAGFTIHSAVHAARHDVGAVFHTHTVAGIAVACQQQGLLPISQLSLAFYEQVKYHDYEGIALNPDEKARLVADLGDGHAMILRSHGLLTAGKDVGMAFLTLFLLEKACAVQVAAGSGGTPLIHQEEEMQKLVHMQSTNTAALGAALAWPALLRKAERVSPGFAA